MVKIFYETRNENKINFTKSRFNIILRIPTQKKTRLYKILNKHYKVNSRLRVLKFEFYLMFLMFEVFLYILIFSKF